MKIRHVPLRVVALSASVVWGVGLLGGMPVLAATPENDMFSNATQVSIPSTHEQVYDTASRELDEPQSSCSNGGTNRTLWFRLVLDVQKEISLAIDGVSWPVVTVYEGSAINSLSEIGCFHYVRAPMLSFTAMPGTTYHIQVGDEFADSARWLQGLRARFTTGIGMTYESGQRWVRVDRNDDGRTEIRGGQYFYERDQRVSVDSGRVAITEGSTDRYLSATVDANQRSAAVQCGSTNGYSYWGCGNSSSYAEVKVSLSGVSARARECIHRVGWPFYSICVGYWP